MEATVIYPPTQAADGIRLARLLAQGKGMSDLVQPRSRAASSSTPPWSPRTTSTSTCPSASSPDRPDPWCSPAASTGEHHDPTGPQRPDGRCLMAIDITSPRTDAVAAPVSTPGRLGIGMVGLRLHGGGPLAGLAQRAQLLRPAARARARRARRARRGAAARHGRAGFDWQHVETDWRALVDPRRRRPRRHLHPRRHPRRDRDRGARGRQARAVREAAGQHRRRGASRWPRPPSGRARTASGRWSASPTAACRRSPWPASSSPEGRIGEVRHVRAQYLQDWLVDPESPLTWRLREGARRLGRARRHRRAHRRPDPVHHRRADHGRRRDDRDVRRASGRCAGAVHGLSAAGRRRARPGHRRRRRASSSRG